MHKLILSLRLAQEEYGNDDHSEDSDDANSKSHRA